MKEGGRDEGANFNFMGPGLALDPASRRYCRIMVHVVGGGAIY